MAMSLAELLDALDYNQYPQYYLKTDVQQPPEIASLFRTARTIGVDGIYVFQTSPANPEKQHILPLRPAVYVAEAQTIKEAREIHRYLWNLGQAPFIIVVLPDHIRVYSGFDYSLEEDSILEPDVELDKNSIRDRLADFRAESINMGLLWQKRSDDLKPNGRVDKRLLKNLNTLGGILITDEKLKPEIAHALIGKYIYIRYLRDRKILSDEWLSKQNINIDHVLGRYATVEGLQTLVAVLESWLNGNIFPIDFNELTDRYVSLVAAVFKGDRLLSKNLSQLSLEFQVYDFEYIPIEMLSSIYQQFLCAMGIGKKIGAYYTPKYLADYLLAEMNAVKPLKKGMRILDPSCGSGIFLVLVYRRLIEMEIAKLPNHKLSLTELAKLLEYLYGIERVSDACYIAEFSLILTLLHYADPAELLEESKHFRFPSLHDTHIFQYDFFNDVCPLWDQKLDFDWIVGNPPWIKADSQDEKFAYTWIAENQKERSVGNNSIAEAFSWRVEGLLEPNGCIGLILPATSLYNLSSQKYRQQFFQKYEVLRMTDFSNLRKVLFEGKAVKPAVTMIYHQALGGSEKPLIEHYGPFLINQTSNISGTLWTMTINENDFQAVSPYEAEYGDTATWKFALWGTNRDRRAIARLRRLFPTTLGQLYEENKKNGWHMHQGSDLRDGSIEREEELEHVPYLEGKKRLNTDLMNSSERLFSIPEDALEDLPKEVCYVRVQGGKKGLFVSEPPHLTLNASWKYVVYSEEFFVIRPRQVGLSAPQNYADHLRALSVYLSSSLVRYYMFFQTPSFGIERDRITLHDVKSIPIPNLTPEQIQILGDLQKELLQQELSGNTVHLQEELDERIAKTLNIPVSISSLATEFNRIYLSLIENGRSSEAIRRPGKVDLQAYAQHLQTELDGFVTSNETHHQITIDRSSEMVVCTIELKSSQNKLPIIVREEISRDKGLFARLRDELNKNFSQWVYVQRGLRIFEGSSVHIYKEPRLINWTKSQALNDADDIIAEALSTVRNVLIHPTALDGMTSVICRKIHL
jgi:transcriptional regulator with XRE-family HTH domain